ncbi:hypothetical protein A3Q56_05511, partial [Intoshia linei]
MTDEIVPDSWQDINYDKDSEKVEMNLIKGIDKIEITETNKESTTIKPKKSKKEHINIIFIGHVDAGKSTIGGNIMYNNLYKMALLFCRYLTGMIDKRTLEKYEREAKELNRESWYLSWALDINVEERLKGKTAETGRAFFETKNRRYTLLDAPGHKLFVSNMVENASQADVAVLVISARRGEFETGFERGGQTREHAMLAKTEGIRHLVVAINKMDDQTVNWSNDRYEEIKLKLTPYLKKLGYNTRTDIHYIPLSGFKGTNVDVIDKKAAPWYEGVSLLQHLDTLPIRTKCLDYPVRLPIMGRFKDMGTFISGKVESGIIEKGKTYVIMPNRVQVEIASITSDDVDSKTASANENVSIKLKGVEPEDISAGFVLCCSLNPCSVGTIFDGQIVIIDGSYMITAGFNALMHLHTSVQPITFKNIICTINRKSNKKEKIFPVMIKQDEIAIVRIVVTNGMVCIEPYSIFPQMGRFVLRNE